MGQAYLNRLALYPHISNAAEKRRMACFGITKVHIPFSEYTRHTRKLGNYGWCSIADLHTNRTSNVCAIVSGLTAMACRSLSEVPNTSDASGLTPHPILVSKLALTEPSISVNHRSRL